MNNSISSPPPPVIAEQITEFKPGDLHDLCDAAEAAIEAGGGFGWLKVPERDVMERYWRGVMVVPERLLFVARLDGVIAGSAQLIRPPRNNEAQAHSAQITTVFVAPWARGHGIARILMSNIIAAGQELGLKLLNLDVRESQKAAIRLYENLGFVQWGAHPCYAFVDGKPVPGRYYYLPFESAQKEETP